VRGPLLPAAFAATLLACGGGGTDPGFTLACDSVPVTTLGVGSHAVIDPTAVPGGCLRLPAAGASGAEHLVVALSANGQEALNGVFGAFTLLAGTDNFAPTPPAAVPGPSLFATSDLPLAFHAMLRRRERELAGRPEIAFSRGRPARLVAPPAVGDKRTFKVCRATSCTSFVSVQATAQYAGSRIAVFLDDTVPANGFSGPDIQTLGTLFDQHLYPIDTTAFGRESDVDGNGVVLVLLSDRINALSPNCAQTRQVIVGYFFGLDLDLLDLNSNKGEVFYAAVPDPARPTCFSRSFMLDQLGPVAIHEFQHMISFNRHVLLGGSAQEETWLNEGLSHFAEELGGRLLPAGSCTAGNCLSQFLGGDLTNAYAYLEAPTLHFLVEPGTSAGTLPERGANWLFVRWLADRSPTDSLLGTDITRRLLGADQAGVSVTGGANVAAAAQIAQAGVTFDTLVGEWHLANHAENLAGFSEPGGRLRYRSWNLAAAFAQLGLGPYPLVPDSTGGASYRVAGTLRGGSGTYVRVVQPAGAQAIALGLQTSKTAQLQPRFAVLRIR
jgi:hypothetical protein